MAGFRTLDDLGDVSGKVALVRVDLEPLGHRPTHRVDRMLDRQDVRALLPDRDHVAGLDDYDVPRHEILRRHLAQLRRDYAEFVERDTEILSTGPDGEDAGAALSYGTGEIGLKRGFVV